MLHGAAMSGYDSCSAPEMLTVGHCLDSGLLLLWQCVVMCLSASGPQTEEGGGYVTDWRDAVCTHELPVCIAAGLSGQNNASRNEGF